MSSSISVEAERPEAGTCRDSEGVVAGRTKPARMQNLSSSEFDSYSTEANEGTCPICYELFEPDDNLSNENKGFGGTTDEPSGNHNTGGQRVLVDGCHHAFCHSCLKEQCKFFILRREIPVPCPLEAETSLLHATGTQENGSFSHHYLSSELVESILTSSKSTCAKTITSTLLKNNENNMKEIDGSENGASELLNDTMSTNSLSSDDASCCSSVSSSPDYWKKYLKIEQLNKDPTLISCTRCCELLPPLTNDQGSSQEERTEDVLPDLENQIRLPYPQITCPHCKHEFCMVHGDSHYGMTCVMYAETKEAAAIQKSEELISYLTKPCSHQCGARIALVSGCDHIICTNCNKDMCYKCGTHIYLSGTVIRSCSSCRQGFIDHRRYCAYRFRLLLLLPVHLTLSAIYFAVMTVAFCFSCGFGCCFCFGTRSWDFRPREPVKRKPPPSSSYEQELRDDDANANAILAPGRGLWMVAKVLCYPMFDLVRDCGCYQGQGDGDRW